jgi:hypothetical protein
MDESIMAKKKRLKNYSIYITPWHLGNFALIILDSLIVSSQTLGVEGAAPLPEQARWRVAPANTPIS